MSSDFLRNSFNLFSFFVFPTVRTLSVRVVTELILVLVHCPVSSRAIRALEVLGGRSGCFWTRWEAVSPDLGEKWPEDF